MRKHLSAIKGGRLAAAAAPAPVVTLAISDVPGDDPAVIASGPTVPDPTTFADARAILAKYAIDPAAGDRRAICGRAREETPKPGDPRLARSRFVLVATPQQALQAAADAARDAGRHAASCWATPSRARRARWRQASMRAHRAPGGGGQQARIVGERAPVPLPAVLLSGGETTVTVRGKGRGGRNAEFLLALARGARRAPADPCARRDTDGIDGTEDNAGALVRPRHAARAAAARDRPQARILPTTTPMARSRRWAISSSPGRHVTNVNDFRAILVEAARG